MPADFDEKTEPATPRRRHEARQGGQVARSQDVPAAVLIAGALDWLRPGGALVLELGETQLGAAADRARDAGLVDISVHPDLAGRDRALVAHAP